jgi:hypothetical protein
MSADLAKNINQQQLQGKLGATGAASAHGQLGLGGFNADTQRGLGAANAQTSALTGAGNILGTAGGQQTDAFGKTYIDPQDQAKFAQEQYNAFLEAQKQQGGLLSGILGKIPGLSSLGKIPGLSGLLQGAGGLAQFIPGLGTVAGMGLSALGSAMGQRR